MDDDKKMNAEESLKAENDFLKMKIMLEQGADFYSPENLNEPLNPEIENQFLNNIIEFEKQFEQRKTIKVFNKIGNPKQFKPLHEIADDAIEDAWNNLSAYMQKHGVELNACSPNVTAKELYRFTVEELFEHEIDDLYIPGMFTNFIYDEFYPDHEYENTSQAIDDCIKLILRKQPVDYIPMLANGNLQLNEHKELDEEKFKALINKFKDGFDEIELKEIADVVCNLQKETCNVTGTHQTSLTFDGIPVTVNGRCAVGFVLENGYWVIEDVQIENVEV